jgi:TonB-dependent receptor
MDTESAFQGNITVPLAIGGNEGALKFGFNVRLRVIRQNATDAGEIKNVGPMSQFVDGPDQIYYNGLYNIGQFVNFPALVAQAYSAQTVDPSAYEHNDEKVYAEYAQYSTTIGRFSLLGGVRIETTNAVYSALAVDANDIPINPMGTEVTDWSQAVVDNKQDYTNVFPDLNLKYQATDSWVLRAAFTTSLARPGFNEITAARSVDLDNNAVSEGNPALKPITAKNIDLTSEYYLAKGGIASVGLFYKDFGNYIVPTTVTLPTSAFPTYSFTGGTTVTESSYADIGSASVKGVELNYQQQFIFLPDWLSGFGVDGNITYNDSNGLIHPGENHTLPQTSPWNYNAAFYYEKYGVALRIAASYVSKNLWAVGSDDATDQYSLSRFRLDFGSSYTFEDHYEVYFDVKNISNTKLEFTQTPSSAYPIQREFYGSDYLFGIKAHF